MMLFLVGVQFALAYYARHVLTAAAQDGATDAAWYGAPPDAATQAADADLSGSRSLVTDVVITPTNSGTSVTVRISARVESVLTFLEPTETVQASAPTERFVPEKERFGISEGPGVANPGVGGG
jgi:hypothetical protein